MKFRSLLFPAAVLLAAALPSAYAAVGIMNLDVLFSGTIPPAGPSPALSVRFEDGLSPNTVRITLDATNLSGVEFASSWYLNTAVDATSITFNLFSNPTALTLADIARGTDAFRADGDGLYDLLFDFPPPPGSFAAKFTSGEKVIVDAYRAAGLTVSDFFAFSTPFAPGNPGPFYSAAHVQGIDDGAGGTTSAWLGANSANLVAIPEPASSAAIAASAVTAALFLRRRIRSAGAPLSV